jgi:hypothetical protein
MTLRLAGFFREIEHGELTGPSLVACRGALDPATRTMVASYLKGGSVLATTGTLVGDWFSPTGPGIATLEIRTDGTWVWPGDLSYYVEKYGVELPPEMLEHMAACGWTAKQLTLADLLAAETQLFRQSTETS